MAALARIAATLVAVTLSGTPRIVALSAPPERHRCTCGVHAGGDPACDCALCHKAALLSRASDQSLPPCHRAAAHRELASGDARRPAGAPCVEGTCGSGARPTLTAAGVEAFCLPASAPLVVVVPERPVPTCAEPAPERTTEPETPPPRPRPV